MLEATPTAPLGAQKELGAASARPTRRAVIRGLLSDLGDSAARRAYCYAFIWQLPGLFGNVVRARFISRLLRSVGPNLQVLAGSRLFALENLAVGGHVTIGYDNHIDASGGITLGDHVTTAPGVQIISQSHAAIGQDRSVAVGAVRIDADVLLASKVIVLPGVFLPRGCIVSAASVVEPRSYRPYSVLAGNPARVIGIRGGGENSGEDSL